MMEVTNKFGSMLTFSGEILMLFDSLEIQGCHIKQVTNIELKMKKNGNSEIWVTARVSGHILMLLSIEADQIMAAQAFVDHLNSKIRR